MKEFFESLKFKVGYLKERLFLTRSTFESTSSKKYNSFLEPYPYLTGLFLYYSDESYAIVYRNNRGKIKTIDKVGSTFYRPIQIPIVEEGETLEHVSDFYAIYQDLEFDHAVESSSVYNSTVKKLEESSQEFIKLIIPRLNKSTGYEKDCLLRAYQKYLEICTIIEGKTQILNCLTEQLK